MSIEKMREEFEAWAISQNWVVDRDSFGVYRHGTARDGWEAWQASRAALVIELPKRDGVNMYGTDVAVGVKAKP